VAREHDDPAAKASETALEGSLQGGRASAPSNPQKVANPPKPSDRLPAAGPHADPSLMNEDATPGAGSLPEVGGGEKDVGSTSG
jgi:hypothetical protein